MRHVDGRYSERICRQVWTRPRSGRAEMRQSVGVMKGELLRRLLMRMPPLLSWERLWVMLVESSA